MVRVRWRVDVRTALTFVSVYPLNIGFLSFILFCLAFAREFFLQRLVCKLRRVWGVGAAPPSQPRCT